jgi:hypothetical protein
MIRQSFLLRSRLLSFSASAGPALRSTTLRSFASTSPSSVTPSYSAASSNADLFDEKFTITQSDIQVEKRRKITAFPQGPKKPVPSHIVRPPYAADGIVPYTHLTEQILVHDKDASDHMRHAARLARQTLDLACAAAAPGVTSDEVDRVVHNAIIAVRIVRRETRRLRL